MSQPRGNHSMRQVDLIAKPGMMAQPDQRKLSATELRVSAATKSKSGALLSTEEELSTN